MDEKKIQQQPKNFHNFFPELLMLWCCLGYTGTEGTRMLFGKNHAEIDDDSQLCSGVPGSAFSEAPSSLWSLTSIRNSFILFESLMISSCFLTQHKNVYHNLLAFGGSKGRILGK